MRDFSLVYLSSQLESNSPTVELATIVSGSPEEFTAKVSTLKWEPARNGFRVELKGFRPMPHIGTCSLFVVSPPEEMILPDGGDQTNEQKLTDWLVKRSYIQPTKPAKKKRFVSTCEEV